MKQFLIHRWFLLALVGVIVVGSAFSNQLTALFEALPRSWESVLIAAIMFLMALPLDASAIGRALRRPTAVALGVGASFVIAPLVAWAIAPLLSNISRDLGLGLLIAAAVPTTVASAAVWTRRAGGNDAVALLVMMVTNLSCSVVTPLLLWITAGAEVGSEKFEKFRLVPMMLRLALIVAVPLLLAQTIRLAPRVAAWSARRKTPLGVICQLGMLTMVLTGVVQCGEKLHGTGTQGIGWAATIAAVLVVHLSAFVAGQSLGRLLHLPREDWIAVGFAGSQKTLLIGLGIAIGYTDVFGPLAVLPMVVYHAAQLLADTVIADRLRG